MMMGCCRIIFVLVVFVASCVADNENCTYTIVASKVIKSGQPYYFSVSTFCKSISAYKLQACITGDEQILANKSFLIKSGVTKIHSLPVPKLLPEDEYLLQFYAFNGLSFEENRTVSVKRKLNSLFIQTDKAMYKPGDKVLFRILAINPDLKPFKHSVNISIYDSKENRVYQVLNQHNNTGVLKGEFQLSKVTMLGRWYIKAETKSQVEVKYFEIAEYVLPKFKVDLQLPPYYYININNPSKQEALNIVVSARYTYDQPVVGTVIISVKISSYYTYNFNPPTISKLLKLDNGRADMTVAYSELLSLIPCSYGEPSLDYTSIVVEANVTETATGKILSNKKSVYGRSKKYDLDFMDRSIYFKPGFPFTTILQLRLAPGYPPLLNDIQHADGTLKQIPVLVKIGFEDDSSTMLEEKYLVNITTSGIGLLTIETNPNIRTINFQAAFYHEQFNNTIYAFNSVHGFATGDGNQIQVSLGTNSNALKAESAATFYVKSSEPIKSFFYQIFGKDNLHLSQEVIGENSTEHEFTVNITRNLALTLAPEATIVVSCVDSNNELIVDSIAVTVEDFFFNKVQLSFDKNVTKPSEVVTLNVEASPGSFVGLLAVDESVLLLKSGNDFSRNEIEEELYRYTFRAISRPKVGDNPLMLSIRFGGQDTFNMLENSGIHVISNNYIHEISYEDDSESEDDEDGGTKKRTRTRTSMHKMNFISASQSRSFDRGSSPAPHKTRSEFPETWIWTDIFETNGTSEVTLRVPDTITSWVATAFATNDNTGLGLSNNPAIITVFKSMFVSLNLPYSVKRGEEFALEATVFNYLDIDLQVDVTLAQSSHFKIRRCESNSLDEVFESKDVKTVKVPKKGALSVFFWIVPVSVGHIPVEVSAFAGVAADAVRMSLLVKPEGQPQSYSTSTLIEASSANTTLFNFHVSLPPSDMLVSESAVIEVSAIRNIFASAVNNLEDLLDMPAGCGEQNIITFAPNVYILKYLQATKELSEDFKESATNLLVAGFNQQLTYQRADGSYSAFGDKDKQGSLWLSAFVMKAFRHSKSYLTYSPTTVTKTLKWILDHQSDDGSFSEPFGAKVIHSMMQGGASSGIALTAYVLISLQENVIYKNRLKNLELVIKKATSYLEREYRSVANDSYALSIVTYSFHLVKSSQFRNAFTLLDALAVVTNDSIHWETNELISSEEDIWRPFYSKPLTYDVEATSYALLTYASLKKTNSILIAKWLIQQRNEHGGFRSTQDTVIGLEALSKFALLLVPQKDAEGVQVTIRGDVNYEEHQFSRINQLNSLLLQTVQLHTDTKQVTVSANGKGYAVVQLSVRYNIRNPIRHPQLFLDLSTSFSKGIFTLEISTSWKGDDASGMVLVEIDVPTGYSYSDDNDVLVKLGGKGSKIETSGSKIIIYMNELTNETSIFDVNFEEKISVFGGKPSVVKVYRYYEPDSSASAFYTTSGKKTWLSACPDCC